MDRYVPALFKDYLRVFEECVSVACQLGTSISRDHSKVILPMTLTKH